MAKYEDGCYGSLKGVALIAKVLAGRCRMHYTRVAAGKGAIPDDMTPKALTEPPEYVMDAIISAVTNPVDGECQVSVQINSAYVKDGFYCTWLVLYAEDPDEGEVPFTALCLENEPEWIRPSSAIVGKLAHFDIIAAVGDVDVVTATIDPNAFATLETALKLLKDHGQDATTHQDIRVSIEEVRRQIVSMAIRQMDLTVPASGWTKDGEGTCPCRLDMALDAAESMIPMLTVLPQSTADASDCGLAPFAQTLDGTLRLWAERVPQKDIHASLALLRDSSGLTLVGGALLTPATPEQIGGVKVGPGLNVTEDGTLSVDMASEEDVAQMLDETLSGGKAGEEG